jgi:hypothetical protein
MVVWLRVNRRDNAKYQTPTKKRLVSTTCMGGISQVLNYFTFRSQDRNHFKIYDPVEGMLDVKRKPASGRV